MDNSTTGRVVHRFSIEKISALILTTIARFLTIVYNGNAFAVSFARLAIGKKLFALLFTPVLIWAIYSAYWMYNFNHSLTFRDRAIGAVAYMRGVTQGVTLRGKK